MCIRDRSYSCKNELISNSDKIVENRLFKSDIVKTNSGAEVSGEVEFNNEVLALSLIHI